MRIAFPLQEDKGLDSIVHGHFGSARYYLMLDAATRNFNIIINQDADHAHGQCNPMAALGGNQADAIVVGGIGGSALKKLNQAGVMVYRGIEGSVTENLELLLKGKLPEFTMSQTCAGHTHPDGCAH